MKAEIILQSLDPTKREPLQITGVGNAELAHRRGPCPHNQTDQDRVSSQLRQLVFPRQLPNAEPFSSGETSDTVQTMSEESRSPDENQAKHLGFVSGQV